MFSSPATISASDALAELQSALDALAAVDLVGLDQTELLDATRRFEEFKRRIPVIDHALIGELRDRGTARELCATSDVALLQGLLRVSPAEAGRRLRAAANLGRRRSLSGQVLPPLFGLVAQAQAGGTISAEHAAVITGTIDKLPAAVANTKAWSKPRWLSRPRTSIRAGCR